MDSDRGTEEDWTEGEEDWAEAEEEEDEASETAIKRAEEAAETIALTAAADAIRTLEVWSNAQNFTSI